MLDQLIIHRIDDSVIVGITYAPAHGKQVPILEVPKVVTEKIDTINFDISDTLSASLYLFTDDFSEFAKLLLKCPIQY